MEELSIKLEENLFEGHLFEGHLGHNAEFLATFLRQNQSFLGKDNTSLFVADAHAMNTIGGSTSGDNQSLGEPATPATKITKGKRATKATKTNNPNADYNPSKRDHNSNNNGESMDK